MSFKFTEGVQKKEKNYRASCKTKELDDRGVEAHGEVERSTEITNSCTSVVETHSIKMPVKKPSLRKANDQESLVSGRLRTASRDWLPLESLSRKSSP